MEQDSQDFARRVEALESETYAVADELAGAVERIRAEGRLPSAVLTDRLAELEQRLDDLCAELHGALARAAPGSAPAADEPSLKTARLLVERLAEAEQSAGRVRAAALAILDRALTIVHVDRPTFPPLAACQEEARRLQAEIAWATELPAMARELVAGAHPIAALVTLVAEGARLDYARYEELIALVLDTFGQAFVTPLARGSLQFTPGSPPGAPARESEPLAPEATPVEEPAEEELRPADALVDAPAGEATVLLGKWERAEEPVGEPGPMAVAATPAEAPAEEPADPAAEVQLELHSAADPATAPAVAMRGADAQGGEEPAQRPSSEEWPEAVSPAVPAAPPAEGAQHAETILAQTTGDMSVESELPWLAALASEDEAGDQGVSTMADVAEGTLHGRAVERLTDWMSEHEHLPYAYLIASWLNGRGPEGAEGLSLPELYEVAAYAFNPKPGAEHYPGTELLYQLLLVDPPTSEQVSAWYLAAALTLLRSEATAQDLLEFDVWMKHEEWEPWTRLGRALLNYLRQGGRPLSEMERRLDKAIGPSDPEFERRSAAEILASISDVGYFDFKKGQRLSLIMNRELDWLRQSLQDREPSARAIEWATDLRVDRQVDRWADEAEPRKVALDGRRRQTLLRDLQALRSHIMRWETAITQQSAARYEQAALHALHGLAVVVWQEREGWQRAWAGAGQPMITAWCTLLLRRLCPLLDQFDTSNLSEVAP